MAFAFALLQFLLSLTFTTFLSLPIYIIATSISFTNPITKPPRLVAPLQAKKVGTLDTADAVAHLVPHHRVVLVAEFSIGQPPVQQHAIIDTGSDLFWLQCLPCTQCINSSDPMYNPSNSSTYFNLPCSHTCEYVLNCKCNMRNLAEYCITYVDHSSSLGLLATEQFVFETSDEGNLVVPNITFGCGHENIDGTSESQLTGVIGLNAASSSLVRQLGNRFSYCIGSLSDPNDQYTQLIIGEGANILGDTTPFRTFKDDYNYYVELEGISIGEKRLDIDISKLKVTERGEGGVIIDSGTTDTHLVEAAYRPLYNEVINLNSGLLKRRFLTNELCYEGNPSEALDGFPAVTFHFAGGADLVLESESLFRQSKIDNVFCMSIRRNNIISDSSIIGIVAQQFYNVGYDLDEKIISFESIACELLYDED